MQDEAWSEVNALSEDARRKHVHWVHVRTHDENHKQPDSFIRQGFWEHMCRVYKDAYPETANQETNSILMFGLVAKERHVPYRESKLTRILSDSLGGSSYTALLLAITPNSEMISETMSTLGYGMLARNIVNLPKKDEVIVKKKKIIFM